MSHVVPCTNLPPSFSGKLLNLVFIIYIYTTYAWISNKNYGIFWPVLKIYKILSYCIWEGNGTSLQYSCLENPTGGGAWLAAVHGVARSQTRLTDFTFTFHFHVLEKEMATHSSVLAWRIPGTGEPGGLPSVGSHRVGHDWSDLAAAAAYTSKITLKIFQARFQQ